MRRRAIFLLVAAAKLDAQSVQEPLRVTARLVEVSVVAEDKNGRPVAGLTRDDFTLRDGNRPETIAFFSIESSRPPSPPRAMPPNVFTNRIEEASGGAAGATVILFDGLNTRLVDQAYARRQILDFLGGLKPGERAAIYVMGRGPRLLQDFTADVSALTRALESYQGGHPPSLEASLYDPSLSSAAHFGSWLGELNFNLYDTFERDRGYRTIRALVAIANHLERLPGRKNLIWVAGSFPIWLGEDSVPVPRKGARPQGNVHPELERLARALGRANVAVYPVDARGLMAPQQYRADRAEAGPDTSLADQGMLTMMRMLAGRTGGRAFYHNNDLAAAMRRAADDSRLTYLLGYYPSHNDWDGRFREIKVEVNRPGVELLYRRGYFAQAGEPPEPWYREKVMDAAVWSPVDSTGIALTVAVRPAPPGAIDLDVQIDAKDVSFREKDGRWECALDLWLVQLDAKDNQAATAARTNNLRLDPETYQRVMAVKGLALRERVTLAPGALLVRVLVRDLVSGALGSVTVPLKRGQPDLPHFSEKGAGSG